MEKRKVSFGWLNNFMKNGHNEKTCVKGVDAIDFIRTAESSEQKATPEDLLQDLTEDMNDSASSQSEEDKAIEEMAERMLNINMSINLYKEILYRVTHAAGCRRPSELEESLKYLKEVFKMDSKEHDLILKRVKSIKPPSVQLHVEILEAKNIIPTDANGLSDPFCVAYLTSDSTKQFKTIVKFQTLNPVWEEQFVLPVSNLNDDSLCIEVWDFDPEETVKEKVRKISEVHGGQGLCKFIEEIATSALHRNHEHEFVGCVDIDLKAIPVEGQTLWMDLEKEDSKKFRGSIKIKTSFSTIQDSRAAVEIYRSLLVFFIMHEIDSSLAGEEWNGELNSTAVNLLNQQVVQGNISEMDVLLEKLNSYSEIISERPISSSVLNTLLQSLVLKILNRDPCEEVTSFWKAVKKILPSCFRTIKSLWKLPSDNDIKVNHIRNTVGILATLMSIELSLPHNLNLFAQSEYDWLKSPKYSMRNAIEDTLKCAAWDWYTNITEENSQQCSSDKERLSQKTQIIKKIHRGLETMILNYDQLFVKSLNVPFAKIMYTAMECKVKDRTELLVKEVCSTLKLQMNQGENQTMSKEVRIEIGRGLFELYKEVQNLSKLGSKICPTLFDSLGISKYHMWFYPAVPHWFDVVVEEAEQLVEKSIEVDRLEPVVTDAKHSSSAVDTVEVYHRKIKDFWTTLSWPNVDESFSFLAKILEDVYRCSKRYADSIVKKIHTMSKPQNGSQDKFIVTPQWGMAVNNIDFLIQQTLPFAKELGLDSIINKIATSKGDSEAKERRNSMETILSSVNGSLLDRLTFILDTIVQKMTPTLRSMLMECTDLAHPKDITLLTEYFDESLTILHKQVSWEHFETLLTKIFQNILGFTDDLIKIGLEKRQPPTFFEKLQTILDCLKKFFWHEENFKDTNNQLSNIETRLKFLGMSTQDIMMKVHNSRLKEQKQMTEGKHGQLTVKVRFDENTLYIDVLNARNLLPMDSSGSSDPYVRIAFLPAEEFVNVDKPKTKVISQELFPLFDETFTIQLTKEQKELKDAKLLFMVKDQDLYGVTSQFLGEAYIAFSEIPETAEEVPQTHLLLSVPSESSLDSKAMRVLTQRDDDKLAREFVKRQRSKHDHGSVPT